MELILGAVPSSSVSTSHSNNFQRNTMMKKYIFIAATLLGTSSLMTSCNDTLTEKPDSYYEKDTYFTSESKAEMAVMGIYNSISNTNHYGSAEMATPTSDDMYFINGTSTDNTRRDISHYLVTSNNTWLKNIWTLNYQGIDRANMAIDGIGGMSGYAENNKLKQLDAEARFLRAFQAFDLVKYFGDVPFKTTYSTTYASAFGPRVDREKIYDQIIEDLSFAKENLPWATSASSPERASQGAARALLMRVLLQRAGYSLRMNGQLERPNDETRKQYFEQVVKEWEAFAGSNHDFYTGGYEAFFKTFSELELNSQESIFEIAFQFEDKKSSGGWWATYNGPEVGAPSADTQNTAMGRANAFFRVVPEWYNFFEDGDQRRDVTICRYGWKWDNNKQTHVKNDYTKNQSKWFPGKWRREWMALGYKDPNCTDVNYCVLRYADVVLMAAEAYNELGNIQKAWNLINQVRERADATQVTDANYAEIYKHRSGTHTPNVYNLVVPSNATVEGVTPGKVIIDDSDEQGKVRTALYWERAFELAFEGQRKYDLIRWGILKDVLTLFGMNSKFNSGSSKGYPAYLNFIPGKHELFPIPLSEMQSNPLLEGKNNPGYN